MPDDSFCSAFDAKQLGIHKLYTCLWTYVHATACTWFQAACDGFLRQSSPSNPYISTYKLTTVWVCKQYYFFSFTYPIHNENCHSRGNPHGVSWSGYDQPRTEAFSAARHSKMLHVWGLCQVSPYIRTWQKEPDLIQLLWEWQDLCFEVGS